MTAFFSNTIVASNSTDAFFRAWVTFLDNAFTAGGWVLTADSGQLDPTTVLHPTVSNAKAGYRIYRMNDALQAANPVYLRVDYGQGTINSPSIWLTIGTGSTGAGVITGIVFNGGSSATPQVTTSGTNNTSVTNSYASADSSRISAMLFTNAAMFVFSLERGKALTGADDGSMLYLSYGSGTGNIGAIDHTACIVRTGGGQPPVENGATVVIANQNASTFSSDVGIGLFVHFKGVAQPIGLGMCAVDSGDFLGEAQIVMAVYGVNHTYVLSSFGGSNLYVPTGNGNSALRSNTRVGIRYD